MLRQLTDQDALFLYLETDETPMHVGGVSLVELPEGHRGDFHAEYRALIADRMRYVPFMHQKLAELPLDLDRPFWVEADEIDLDHHVRHETLPAPGSLRELEELVARLHASRLDRTRPLWQFFVIDGLASGQVAIYTKLHHAAMDGASSLALITTMYDPTPAPRVFPPAPPPDGTKRGRFESIVQGLMAHLVRQEIRAVHFVPQLVEALAQLVLPDPINDVVLAICSGALRRWLTGKGGLPEESLTALVPISKREAAEAATANRNGMFPCSLATDAADPRGRLDAIHASAIAQKKRLESLWNLPWPDVPAPGIGLLLHRLVELYGKSGLVKQLPRPGNLVISNVPGPALPLYVAGAKILTMYPCSIPFHGTALNITVESYGDRLDFGLIACRRAVPDLAALADGLADSLAELKLAVAPHVAADGGINDDHPDGNLTARPPRDQAAEAGPASGDREAQPARRRPAKAHRDRAQGHRGVARRQ